MAASVAALAGLVLSFPLVTYYSEIASQPASWFWAVVLCDALLCWVAWIRPESRRIEPLGGCLTFLLLASWTLGHLTAATLWWGLGVMLAFSAIHAATPVAWRRMRGGSTGAPGIWPPLISG